MCPPLEGEKANKEETRGEQIRDYEPRPDPQNLVQLFIDDDGE